ncbi:endonuclease/exonuclease/phosphatase family protein [Deinococcus hohokamensis]|uniref:Endonuclease/exonuclease/phosphatase family protein n=1 Tax=Deinococcus hohokamensis TaxID=309883 RepID=A0ABV9I8C8_9DEIO
MARSKLAWTYLLLVALGWALAETVGESRWPTLVLAYAPPLLWLLPAPVVLLWTFGRRRGVAVALAGTLLAAWGAGLLHWRPQSEGTLRVLTYNVARSGRGQASGLARTLKEADADLILLQETNFYRPEDLAVLRAALPGYQVVRAYEVTTFSRLPVQASAWFDLPANRRDVLLTRVKWQGRTLSVVNAHLGTVTVSSLLEGQVARLQQTRTARMGQVRVLERVARQERGRGPLLLAGDLNTPPRGLVYRQLQAAFGPDAHDQAGRGPGWTFPSLRTRIDHMLARGLTPTRSQVLPSSGSDHLPLLVEYR